MSPRAHLCHPYHHLIPDLLSIIFSYHILEVQKPVYSFTHEELDFVSMHVHCFSFQPFINVKSFLRRIFRHPRVVAALYVDASRNDTLDRETFTFFRGIRELDISYSRATNYGIDAFKNLRGIHTLRAANNNRLTDEACIELRGIRSLSIPLSDRLTDAAFSNFRGIEELDLSYFHGFISNEAFVHLRGIKRIIMHNCSHISDGALQNLVGVEEVDISNSQISDSGLHWFRGAHKIQLSYCNCITDRGIRELRDVRWMSLTSPGTGITDCGLKYLRNVRQLLLSRMTLVSGNIFDYFGSLEDLELRDVTFSAGFNDDALKNLSQLKSLTMTAVRGVNLTKHALRYLTGLNSLDYYNRDAIQVSMEEVDQVAEVLRHLRSLTVSRPNEVWRAILQKWDELQRNDAESLHTAQISSGTIVSDSDSLA